MAENRLYKTDMYAAENCSAVVKTENRNGCDAVVCEASVFFPEGGGQPSDRGFITLNGQAYDVLEAQAETNESEVWHLTNAPAGTFAPGDEVELKIDWEYRFRNMQRHCGEHMLSGAFNNLYGGVNRGFHMGEDYITIDIDADGRMFTDEEILLAEETVNRAIREDIPVSVDYFASYEESLCMPVRKQVPHDGEVSVVTVGKMPEPFDCIACCGTHPYSAGQVGLVAIYKHEPNKGMNRIYFDCGSMAMAKLSGDSRMLGSLANRYSCAAEDLPARLEALDTQTGELKGRIAALVSYVKDAEKERILALWQDKVMVYESSLLSLDELLKLGFAVSSEKGSGLLVLLNAEAHTALLFSQGEIACGSLVKEHAGEFGGRGGGRQDNARAVFAGERDMKNFAKKLAEMV